MNGYINKAVIDTNVIFMALYSRQSKAGKIIQYALEGKIKLYATDTVKEEIKRVLKRELYFSDEEINKTITSLPVTWIEKHIYESALDKTKVKHFLDKPVEALSLILNCGILTANKKHFKERIDVDKFLKEIEK